MIQVVNRALDILEYCAKHPDKELSLSNIADHAGLNNTTCANILKTLVSRKYIEQIAHKKGYRLGSMSYLISGNTSYRGNIVGLAKPLMKELCEMLNETVIVAVYNKQDNKRVILHTEYSNHDITVRSTKEKNVYDTSTGRLMLAYMTGEERMNVLKYIGLPTPVLWKEATTMEELETEMEKIRKKGYAVQLTASQVVGVAVPVFCNEHVIASMGIYLPNFRFTGELKRLVINELIYVGKALSEKLSNSVKPR